MSDKPGDVGQLWNRWRPLAWGLAAAILLAPAIVMPFSDAVAWGPEDFVLMGAILAGAALLFELAVRRAPNRLYLAGFAAALGTAGLLTIGNLAVGVIGPESNPANAMYFGVVAIALLGSMVARLAARGMARAMVATAVAQLVVPLISLAAGYGFELPINLGFAGLWLLAAWLLRAAGRE